MRLRTSIALLLATLALAPFASAGASGPAGDAAPTQCPSGEKANDGLCIGKGAKAKEAAELVRSTFEESGLGSVIVGVWQHGKPILTGAIGDSLTDVPATYDMHHIAGNIGHMLTTTVLLQQVEKGTISLDDKLSKFLPDIPNADEITIDMVAHSTTGIEHFTILPDFQAKFYEDPFQTFTADELVAFGVDAGSLYPPGTSWNFSDTNILILGQVLEQVTGKSMDELVQQGILDPLGMKDTTSYLNAALPEPVLHGYTGERDVWEDATFWNPSWIKWVGGWGSTHDDLRKLIEAVGNGDLVSKKSHRLQLAPDTVGLGTNTDDRFYAMGISIVDDWLLTAPGLQGYKGAVGYLRDLDLTIITYFTYTPESFPEQAPGTIFVEPLSTIFAPDQAITLSG